jgi:hypothetical protein
MRRPNPFPDYQVFERGKGIVCGPAERMNAAFWVSQPARPFAFGRFLAATESREDAEAIAAAMLAMSRKRKRIP